MYCLSDLIGHSNTAFIQFWHLPTTQYFVHDWKWLHWVWLCSVHCNCIMVYTLQYSGHKCQWAILILKLRIQVLHIGPLPIPQSQKMVDFECPRWFFFLRGMVCDKWELYPTEFLCRLPYQKLKADQRRSVFSRSRALPLFRLPSSLYTMIPPALRARRLAADVVAFTWSTMAYRVP